MTVPLLIYTDAPSHNTGLARICRELVHHIHTDLSDIFRVATLGVFGRGSASYPWMQYSANGPDDALFNLRQVTEDFFGSDRGVVLSITPPSWLFPLALPQFMKAEKPEWKQYSEWMATDPFERWAYLAIESHGPHNQYGPTTAAILRGVERRLYYSRWGAEIARNTCITETDGVMRYIHHGIDCQTWTPAPADIVRKFRADLQVGPNDLLLGCVATNTRRKLLPLLFESAHILRHQLGTSRLKLWLNTDVQIREYNLTELAECFGFRIGADLCITSSNAKRPDQWLAGMYSACDITALPTGGEGFGYPAIESLACGTPVVTGSFGAQSEFLRGWRDAWLVNPVATHLITNNTLVEPIYDPRQFASAMLTAWTEIRQRGTLLRGECRERAVTNWDWSAIWPVWKLWLAQGAADLAQKLTNKEAADGENDSAGEGGLSPTTSGPESLGSAVRGDPEQQGQPTDLRDSGRLDSGAPIGVDREADAAGA